MEPDYVRLAREKLAEPVKLVLEELVKRLNIALKKVKRNEEIAHVYFYPLIFTPRKNIRPKELTSYLGTQTFRITQSSFYKNYYHIVRLSAPSMIVYVGKKFDLLIKMNLINMVYEFVLYLQGQEKNGEGKVEEKKSIFSNDEVSIEDVVVDEERLTNLWKCIFDRMGGNVIDIESISSERMMRLISIAALIVASATLIVTSCNRTTEFSISEAAEEQTMTTSSPATAGR